MVQGQKKVTSKKVGPRVLEITILNPPYNFLTGEILDGISAILRSLDPEEYGAVIISSGIRDIFTSHYDVTEIYSLMEKLPFKGLLRSMLFLRFALKFERLLNAFGLRWLARKTILHGMSNLNSYHECTRLLRSIPQVTIAKVNGRAMGGGCELALACDFRVMADTPPEGDSKNGLRGSGIGQPEVTIGLLPGGGGTLMLKNMLGSARALEISIDNPLLTAQEALKVGLVNKICSFEEINKVTLEWAIRLARRMPAAVAAIKDSIYNGTSTSLEDGMLQNEAHFAALALVPEADVAMRHYVKNIDNILGSKDGLKAFQPLLEGTFSDMTPGSAAKATLKKNM